MTRPTPDDRQRVIDLAHAILRREGWRVHAAPRRIVRPCVWVDQCDHPAGELWVFARVPRTNGCAWCCAIHHVRAPGDGTGHGWHRRAAERIAATVRGWR